MKLARVVEILEEYAPLVLANEGDNVGLQIGSLNADIKKIVLTLDLTLDIVKKINPGKNTLIYTHHPLFFEPIKNVDFKSSRGVLISYLIKRDANVYSAHTNLDAAPLGINYYLGSMLGVNKYNKEVLIPTYKEKMYKVVVFVPREKTDKVRNEMARAGGGQIGEYKFCSFITKGQGAFLAGAKASPYAGKKGVVEKVEEDRLEMIVGGLKLDKVIKAMKNSHPYETVAYDLYLLANEGETYGYGYLVHLDKSITTNTLMRKITAEQKGYKGDKLIKKLAYLSGTSRKVFDEVIKRKADCLVIGEIDYHQDLTARDEKMIVLEMGHYESENFIFKKMINNLRHKFGKDIMMKTHHS